MFWCELDQLHSPDGEGVAVGVESIDSDDAGAVCVESAIGVTAYTTTHESTKITSY